MEKLLVGKNILVVEDEIVFCLVIVGFLSLFGVIIY